MQDHESKPKPQVFRSQYGRPRIQVPAECPTRSIRHRLASTYVGTSDADVEAMIREAVAAQAARGNVFTAKQEADAVRFGLWQHAENRAEYRAVMSGRLG